MMVTLRHPPIVFQVPKTPLFQIDHPCGIVFISKNPPAKKMARSQTGRSLFSTAVLASPQPQSPFSISNNMTPEEFSAEIETRSAFVAPLRAEISRVLIGQNKLVDRMLVCLLTGNHLLVEGLPGLAKTLAVNTLAQTLQARFGRIQFTPDLLPADVIGTHIYNPGTQEFTAKEGPVFTNLLLADEINRAPAKVQSALLEAMQEKQVTLGGKTRPLPNPFLVMATQNPLDQEGTYPLPEAQMDRFMMKVIVGYPQRDEEREVLRRMSSTVEVPSASAVTTLESITAARTLINDIHVDPKIEDYILDIVFATRAEGRLQLSDRQAGLDLSAFDPLITAGASPRATIQLIRAARCLAFLEGRAHVLPEDVKAIAPDILRHRIIASYEAQAEDMSADTIINQLLDTLRTP